MFTLGLFFFEESDFIHFFLNICKARKAVTKETLLINAQVFLLTISDMELTRSE